MLPVNVHRATVLTDIPSIPPVRARSTSARSRAPAPAGSSATRWTSGGPPLTATALAHAVALRRPAGTVGHSTRRTHCRSHVQSTRCAARPAQIHRPRRRLRRHRRDEVLLHPATQERPQLPTRGPARSYASRSSPGSRRPTIDDAKTGSVDSPRANFEARLQDAHAA
jgi:hypothetical protein